MPRRKLRLGVRVGIWLDRRPNDPRQRLRTPPGEAGHSSRLPQTPPPARPRPSHPIWFAVPHDLRSHLCGSALCPRDITARPTRGEKRVPVHRQRMRDARQALPRQSSACRNARTLAPSQSPPSKQMWGDTPGHTRLLIDSVRPAPWNETIGPHNESCAPANSDMKASERRPAPLHARRC